MAVILGQFIFYFIFSIFLYTVNYFVKDKKFFQNGWLYNWATMTLGMAVLRFVDLLPYL